MFLIDLTNTDNSIDALEDARDVVDQSTLDPTPFEYSPVFIFTEQVPPEYFFFSSFSCLS